MGDALRPLRGLLESFHAVAISAADYGSTSIHRIPTMSASIMTSSRGTIWSPFITLRSPPFNCTPANVRIPCGSLLMPSTHPICRSSISLPISTMRIPPEAVGTTGCHSSVSISASISAVISIGLLKCSRLLLLCLFRAYKFGELKIVDLH